jgi:hypothetical protein
MEVECNPVARFALENYVCLMELQYDCKFHFLESVAFTIRDLKLRLSINTVANKFADRGIISKKKNYNCKTNDCKINDHGNPLR